MNRWAAVARLGGLGDDLIAGSVCAPLKKQGYMVEMICSEPNHVVFLNNPHIDKLSVKQVPRDMPQGDPKAWQAWFNTRANEYDVFIHLTHSVEGRHAVFEAMTSFWWPDDYRRKVCAGNYLETAHEIAGVPFEFGPLYYATDEEKTRALETKKLLMGDKKCVTFILSGSRIDKVYPYCSFLVARIVKELDAHVVLMGAGPKEFAMAQAIVKHVKLSNSTTDLECGVHLALSPQESEHGGLYNWPIRRSLGYAITASDVVITPDTGPAWACALEPMPKIALLSHASAENITKNWINTTTLHADQNRVPCWPCHKLHDTKDTCVENKEKNGAACISDISVETIMGHVKKYLEQPAVNNVIHAEGQFAS